MDPNTATLIGGVVGGLVGAPVGYFVDRFFNRPRIHVGYAECGYEDIISLPVPSQMSLLRLGGFVNYVEQQVKWSFEARVAGNAFTSEELRLVHEMATHYRDLSLQQKARSQNQIQELQRTKKLAQDVMAGMIIEYKKQFDSVLTVDLQANEQQAIERIQSLIEGDIHMNDAIVSTITPLIAEIATLVSQKRPSTNKLVVRVGVGNQGFQDGVISTKAQLQVDSKLYKLPMRTGARPWEVESNKGLSNYTILKAKSFQVLEFGVDETLNATADVNQLRQMLKRGTKATFVVFGIGTRALSRTRFFAVLPE